MTFQKKKPFFRGERRGTGGEILLSPSCEKERLHSFAFVPPPSIIFSRHEVPAQVFVSLLLFNTPTNGHAGEEKDNMSDRSDRHAFF
mmetsp:Transcript_26130/g.51298  ORF Transcript_26130/g.51298 Transcript_26130/m.51298 type:complete len:87 (-) Transcript_26130:6077-6337(-)